MFKKITSFKNSQRGENMEQVKLPLVSFIFPVKNEGENVRNTLDSALGVKSNFPFEFIVVNDNSTDGCCDFISTYAKTDQLSLIETEGIGAANARNAGAEHAKGDYLIFCDAHLFFEDAWIDRLLEPILSGQADATTPGIAPTNSPDVVGYGQTLNEKLEVQWNTWSPEPFPTAILPGGCFAITREAFFNIGGFDAGSRVWGYEDVEISIKLWLFGYSCWVQPSVKILHLFREKHPYVVHYEHVYYNLLRMAYIHLSEERISKCKQLIIDTYLNQIEAEVLAAGVLEQRKLYFENRRYDDQWFFNTFGIHF